MVTAAELLAAVCGLSFTVLMFRALITVERTSRTACRSESSDRRDYLNIIEKLVEKTCTKDMSTTLANHASERVTRVTTDAKVEQTELFLAHQPEAPIEDDAAINV